MPVQMKNKFINLKNKIRQKSDVPWWYFIVAFFSQTISWIPWKHFIATRYKLIITGKENLKKAKRLRDKYKSGVLFLVKHTGELDIMLVLTGISPFSPLFPMFYLTQHVKYYQTKDFGWRRFVYRQPVFYFYGAHPLQCENPADYSVLNDSEKYKIALKRHMAFLKKNRSVCVFPEGKIPKPGNVGKFFKGISHLLDTKTVVVPVVIKREKEDSLRPIIKLHYGEPLDYDTFTRLNKKEAFFKDKDISEHLSSKVREHIKHTLSKI